MPIVARNTWLPSRAPHSALWSALLLLLCGFCGNTQASGPLKEEQLKAAFLYNILKFVEWPPQSVDPNTPITIGIMNDEVLRNELETIVKTRTLNGRSIAIKAVAGLEDATSVEMLFIPAEAEQQFTPLWPAIRELPVLAVGESAWFAKLGGTIRFTRVNDKLRFEINMASAEHAGLKISAQLQKLAVLIRRES